MAVYREEIIDIDLDGNGSLHRSFMNHSIGKGDNLENRYGVRLFRNKTPVNLDAATCQGLFMAPDGSNILISGTYCYAGGNIAYVQLPQACYNVEGQFSLAIKVIDGGVTGTMRIIDGVVNNTGYESAVEPTESVPTYQEILAVYNQMLAAKAGAVRYDIDQELTKAQRTQARNNIGMVLIEFVQTEGDKYIMDVSTDCEFVNVEGNKYALVMHAD